MSRVFLDANILFSASYTRNSKLRRLWSAPQTELVTSRYALAEAHRNLPPLTARGVAALEELDQLASGLLLVDRAEGQELPEGVELHAGDVPILLAAIAAGCTHLLTGNTRHFGHLYGQRVAGVLVQRPDEYLQAGGGT